MQLLGLITTIELENINIDQKKADTIINFYKYKQSKSKNVVSVSFNK